ncbi:DNA alkylation repair protein [Capnocytophaga sp. ARDL2]|uniref:DNA alkylation repair protein n=1 Tax=Capnocytophaga sp. ARDL2 TaxID=3238809 RepID=UPI003556B12A
MTHEIQNRKGATKLENIPQQVLELLNAGKIVSVNLTEWLAVNHITLVASTFSEMGISDAYISEIQNVIKNQKKPSTMNTIKLIGAFLYEKYAQSTDYLAVFEKLSTHLSDSVRCYATYFMALNTDFSLEKKLGLLQPLVADKHFGVREVVWMALRPELSENLAFSIDFLSVWAENEDENIRRFCSEALRPRGVWCSHIETLKNSPELALPILEKLKSDSAKYVQDSVGNWLNDASKSRPDFVQELCKRWEKESPTKSTEYIIKKALRTILK